MRRFTPADPVEFRTAAVQLVRDGGKPVAEIARDLGVSTESLRHWVRREEIDRGHRDGLTTAERDEVRQLRRENRILREEREILKKAAAFFAKETDRTRR
ncbi:MAG: transposase [Chloroflexi bacterium]|nr:transposase [Chloroflexota bacterium]